VNAARDVPVRQKAFEDADGTLHILDAETNQAGGPDTVFFVVANPECTKNVLFVTRADGLPARHRRLLREKPGDRGAQHGPPGSLCPGNRVLARTIAEAIAIARRAACRFTAPQFEARPAGPLRCAGGAGASPKLQR
jgi:hypothetical protein